ncbi:MAG: HAD-IA family hydrolase [Patescibacteria group bacterium]|nr:HAD-IA family hydrolase [Patescibacteria group bacterium]
MTIIFDFDGTIADSFDYISEFLLAEAKIGPVNESSKQVLRGMSMQAMARELGFPWYKLPGLFIRGRRGMAGGVKHLQPFEGMPEVIRKLHAEGHELFLLSSNNVRNIRAFLHAHDLHEYFLEIYGGVGVFGKGPAMRKLLKENNLEISDAIYIGDEVRDAEAGQSIGLDVLSVLWGFARSKDLKAINPKLLAATPKDIITVLER